MTKILPGGLEVSTGSVPAALMPGCSQSERSFVLLGEDIDPFPGVFGESLEHTMTDAVSALSEAFKDPQLVYDVLFRCFKTWLSSFELRVVGWEWGGIDEEYPVIRFTPTTEANITLDPGNPGPTIELLGHELSRNDLIGFTHYLITNSSPAGSQDPRFAFIAELKT